MKLSFKIPKGVSENSLQVFIWDIQTHIGLDKISVTQRMIHIDMGEGENQIDAECWIEDVKEMFEMVSEFIEQNTPY